MHKTAGSLKRLRVHALAPIILLGLCLLATVSPSIANAYSSSGSPWGPIGLQRPVSGVSQRAVPVSRAAISRTLRSLTGYSLSQVSTENACHSAKSGYASCLAQVVVVAGTNRPVHPQNLSSTSGSLLQPYGPFTPMTQPGAAAAPQPGSPAYLQWAYDLGYLSATKGAGDTIAVVDAYHDPTAEQDLQTFRAQYGMPVCSASNGCFTEVNESGYATPLPTTTDVNWGLEASLDLDAVSALCPNCHIIYVETNSASVSDLQAGVKAAGTLGANQISMSFGAPFTTEPAGAWTYPGSSSFAAAGDSGYVPSGQGEFPAADPGVTAVGGTSLAAAAGSRGFSESAWSGSGSGCALAVAKPVWQTDSGCSGRSFADVSADADPATGLGVYDSSYTSPGWMVIGGTSLATPLAAAYAAITGVDTANTPQWSYTDSKALNDVVSGSNGTCGTYICNGGPGYDGPTGNGSISGQVVAGGPGTGGSLASGLSADWTSVTLSGGLYPNSLDTTYYWQYGTTTSYGSQTAPTDAGAGSSLVNVSTQLTGLVAGTTYHFRLVASNADATVYGYDQTFTTFQAPHSTSSPSLSSSSGKFQEGSSLDASTGSWNPSGAMAVSWMGCSGVSGSGYGTGCSSIGGATGSTYTPGTADVGHYIEVAVTEISAYGSSTSTSTAVGPITTVKPIILASPQLKASKSRLHVTGGTYEYGGASATQFDRCALHFRCVHISTAFTYRPRPADQGRYIQARVTVNGPGGSTLARTNSFLVLSADAGVLTVRAGHRVSHVIRGTTGQALARIVVRPLHHGRSLRITVHSFRGRRLVVWGCSSQCVFHHKLRSSLTFKDRHVAKRARVRLVVVRQQAHARLSHVRLLRL